MGFISNIYSGLKSFLPAVHGFAKKGVGFYKESKNYISEIVNKAASIPFIGEALKSGAQKIYKKQINIPIIGGLSVEDLTHYMDEIASFVDNEEIGNYAQQIDQAVSPAVSAADRYFGGAPVSRNEGIAKASAVM